jgi:hypothetical protein
MIIEPNGDIKAVYSDKIKNMNLGMLRVERASNVEFNYQTQQWEASTTNGELIAAGPERDAVISHEIKVIESRL